MTPEQQQANLAAELREALDDPKRYEWGDSPWEHLGDAERDVRVLLDYADRLVAERDEARRKEADAKEKWLRWQQQCMAAEGREAALRDALLTVRAECDLPDHIAEIVGEALGGGS